MMTKLCVDCKYYKVNRIPECIFFKEDDDINVVSGKTIKVALKSCDLARTYNEFCGLEGSKWESNGSSIISFRNKYPRIFYMLYCGFFMILGGLATHVFSKIGWHL